ncbi:MAG: hypothetical protein K0B08_04650 [Bacteroidales bacterium]|nr:hypothetical protein [Bacteroidales bacterium]
MRIKKVWIEKGCTALSILAAIVFTGLSGALYAHCDSYDGPVIRDALKALETHNVSLVLKWVDQKDEPEIVDLFNKTYALKSSDQEIYTIVEKHFLETLVRLHRASEGEPYTGLKPAGSTEPIIKMSDKALEDHNIDDLLRKLNDHLNSVIRDKYEKVIFLSKTKDETVEKGREYVEAYVDYTHTLEAIHGIIENGALHHAH